MGHALLGLVWIAAGAAAIGQSTVRPGRYGAPLKVAVGGAVGLVAFLGCFLGLALPVAVHRPHIVDVSGPRTVVAHFVDLSFPGQVTCGSAWRQLEGSSDGAVHEFDAA